MAGMSEPTAPTSLFTATDEDGDTLVVEADGDVGFVLCVSGEDGHRAVCLTNDQASALAAALRTALP